MRDFFESTGLFSLLNSDTEWWKTLIMFGIVGVLVYLLGFAENNRLLRWALAFVLGMVAQQLKLSPLVGYLVAGMLAAQDWWGHPVDQHVVEEFSHIGVVLLLFGVGLHFHFKDLLAVRKVAVPGAVSCSLLCFIGPVPLYMEGRGMRLPLPMIGRLTVA